MTDLPREIARATHNLREPLRMIRCYADLLQEQPAESAMCVERIQQGTARLETLVSGMFECFHLPEQFHARRVGLPLVYLNAVARLDVRGRAAVSCGDLPAVWGDLEILTEVFSKLFDNALKFGGESITVTAEEAEGDYRIRVQDNGPGIAQVDQERCFGMFERLHGREVPGEGFGLAYCRRAIELHGGEIGIDSAPGEGTTVWFTLPQPR